MNIKKLICLSCGNTEEFIVDSRRESVGATLYFEDGVATLEDKPSSDVEIFPFTCARCGHHIPNDTKLENKNIKICKLCKHRFQCFTEKSGLTVIPKPPHTIGITDPKFVGECRGFEFEEEYIELEDTC